MQTLVVSAGSGLAPVLTDFDFPNAVRVGRPTRFLAWADNMVQAGGDVALTFDLDGDGSFDDVPTVGSFGYYLWTFPDATPRTVAVRATDGAGRFSIRTAEVYPGSENIAPTGSIGPVHSRRASRSCCAPTGTTRTVPPSDLRLGARRRRRLQRRGR